MRCGQRRQWHTPLYPRNQQHVDDRDMALALPQLCRGAYETHVAARTCQSLPGTRRAKYAASPRLPARLLRASESTPAAVRLISLWCQHGNEYRKCWNTRRWRNVVSHVHADTSTCSQYDKRRSANAFANEGAVASCNEAEDDGAVANCSTDDWEAMSSRATTRVSRCPCVIGFTLCTSAAG